MSRRLILYCDGSCAPNRGFAGSGVFGYCYRLVNKSKNFKHPIHDKIYFTTSGFSNEKGEEQLEVEFIYEAIMRINSAESTNNEAELAAFIKALEVGLDTEDLGSLTIYTDSSYIVDGFNTNLDYWIKNNWRRQDNKPLRHINEWKVILNYRDIFQERNIALNVIWVKGHSNNYGNEIADLYAFMGSNASKFCVDPAFRYTDYVTTIYEKVLSYAEYKDSYAKKDFIYFFKDLYFSSDELDDRNYCFISSSDDPELLGKKSLTSIFVTNIGYVPPLINKIKRFYRDCEREYITTCCMKLSKLENRDLFRLLDDLEPQYFLVKLNDSRTYALPRDNTAFLYEVDRRFPFAIAASSIFNNTLWLHETKECANPYIFKFDITNILFDENTKKLKFTNKDKDFDLTEVMGNIIQFKQKPIITVGYDIPNYLALKSIEPTIAKIYAYVEIKEDSNFCTLYINIETTNRIIYSLNIENKYLVTKSG